MNEVNPSLLLIVGLLWLAGVTVWLLSIFLAARLARRAHRRRWPWVLLATLAGFVYGGPAYLGIGYLARLFRRSVVAWVIAQVLAAGAVLLAAVYFLPWVAARPLAVELGLLLAAIVLALGPLILLALLGPRRGPAGGAGPSGALIEAVKLHKSYDLGRRKLRVLRGVSLSVRRGEFVAILGASGSGKSTLLHLLGLLDMADSGRIVLDGDDSVTLSPVERDRMRSRDIGFVFQFYHLLPELNVLENALLPVQTSVGALRWLGVRGQARQRATKILRQVGLGDRLKHRPRELSGGEQQRVAIARALINSPKILLADEPTGNLDSRTGAEILKLLKQLNQESKQTIVMVTHDHALTQAADRILHLRDGRLKHPPAPNRPR